jgi:Ca2+/H+ antiporter, TMEM165/GDT1 family
MLPAFLFLTATLYLAQMGDKTQVLTLLLATRTKRHMMLFFSIMTGFAIGVTLAVIFGAALTKIIPHDLLEIISGIIFIIIGILVLKDGVKKQKAQKVPMGNSFISIVLLIFLADLGDKTQIAVALFSTNYSPWLVWISAMVALGIDTIIIIFFSKAIVRRINEKTVKKLAGLAFIGVGIIVLINNLFLK